MELVDVTLKVPAALAPLIEEHRARMENTVEDPEIVSLMLKLVEAFKVGMKPQMKPTNPDFLQIIIKGFKFAIASMRIGARKNATKYPEVAVKLDAVKDSWSPEEENADQLWNDAVMSYMIWAQKKESKHRLNEPVDVMEIELPDDDYDWPEESESMLVD